MRTDRQTDRWTDGHDEANSRFRNFANAPENRVSTHTSDVARGWPLLCVHLFIYVSLLMQ